MTEKRQNTDIATSSALFMIMGRKVAQSSHKKGITVAGVWF